MEKISTVELTRVLEDTYNRTITPDYRKFYLSTIDYTEPDHLLEDPDRPGKLDGLSVLKLSENCGRCLWIDYMVKAGLLLDTIKRTSCFGGTCWKEFTVDQNFAKARAGVESIAEYRPQVVKSEVIAAMVKANLKAFRETFMYREGQSGCSSHAFIRQDSTGTSPAVEWLQALRDNNIDKITVFISAGYAPVTPEEYRELAKYRTMFVLHFSLSGWFTKEEIIYRLAQYLQAKKAGLNVIIRKVTNKDIISGVGMPNQEYLEECLKALGIERSGILETPFHDDRIKKKGVQKRSTPEDITGPVCCESGHCFTCKFCCCTGIDNSQNDYAKRVAEREAAKLARKLKLQARKAAKAN